jgi:hypothetical protein
MTARSRRNSSAAAVFSDLPRLFCPPGSPGGRFFDRCAKKTCRFPAFHVKIKGLQTQRNHV